MATHLPAGLSPDAVDVVTELSSIITRLRAAQQPTTATTTSTTTTTGNNTHPPPPGATPIPQGGVTGTTPLPTSAPSTSNQKNSNTTAGDEQGQEQELLSVKDLPSATDSLKHKLQRARAAVRTLGDVRRALAQQEAEMRGLEGRRAAQAGRLARTQEDGLVFVRGEDRDREGENRNGEGGGGGESGERMVE